MLKDLLGAILKHFAEMFSFLVSFQLYTVFQTNYLDGPIS